MTVNFTKKFLLPSKLYSFFLSPKKITGVLDDLILGETIILGSCGYQEMVTKTYHQENFPQDSLSPKIIC